LLGSPYQRGELEEAQTWESKAADADSAASTRPVIRGLL
jgi:hypothetical protein